MRPYMYGIAYLLNCFHDFHCLHKKNNIILATRVFGPELVNAAIDPVVSIMEAWGYQSVRRNSSVSGLVCTLLLRNGSPDSQDITTDLIDCRTTEVIPKHARSQLYGVHRVLAASCASNTPTNFPGAQSHDVEGVHPRWLYWVENAGQRLLRFLLV